MQYGRSRRKESTARGNEVPKVLSVDDWTVS